MSPSPIKSTSLKTKPRQCIGSLEEKEDDDDGGSNNHRLGYQPQLSSFSSSTSSTTIQNNQEKGQVNGVIDSDSSFKDKENDKVQQQQRPQLVPSNSFISKQREEEGNHHLELMKNATTGVDESNVNLSRRAQRVLANPTTTTRTSTRPQMHGARLDPQESLRISSSMTQRQKQQQGKRNSLEKDNPNGIVEHDYPTPNKTCPNATAVPPPQDNVEAKAIKLEARQRQKDLDDENGPTPPHTSRSLSHQPQNNEKIADTIISDGFAVARACEGDKKTSNVPETSRQGDPQTKQTSVGNDSDVYESTVANKDGPSKKQQLLQFFTDVELLAWTQELAWLLSAEPENDDAIDWTRVESGASSSLRSRFADVKRRKKILSLKGLEPRNKRRASIRGLREFYRRHCRGKQHGRLSCANVVVVCRNAATMTANIENNEREKPYSHKEHGHRDNNQEPSNSTKAAVSCASKETSAASYPVQTMPLEQDRGPLANQSRSKNTTHQEDLPMECTKDKESVPVKVERESAGHLEFPSNVSPGSMVQMADEEAKEIQDLFLPSDANEIDSGDLPLDDEKKQGNNNKKSPNPNPTQIETQSGEKGGNERSSKSPNTNSATTTATHITNVTPREEDQTNLEILNDYIENVEDLDIMPEANLLERRFYPSDWRTDENGRPRRAIFAYSALDDSIFYHFEMTIRKSDIPRSGLGAFLKFVGGHKLKDRSRKRWLENRKGQMEEILPPSPLQALHPHGHGISVTLRGESISRNFGSIFWPHEAMEKQAKLPGKNELVSVHVVGKHLHYDHEEECRMKSTDSFGVLRQHLHQDFDDQVDSKITFCSRKRGCGLMKLGRYGPFRVQDRKIKSLMDIKNWLFDQEPSGWSFGVTEPLHGQEQIIDITSDTTGMTHEDAESNIPMYVNEVGHNKNLVHNVLSREGADRNVDYYIDIQNEMKPGDEVELLTNYGKMYETNRERKGYGLKNIEGQAKSDCDEASRLEREFEERKDIEDMVKDMNLVRLFHMLEHLHEHIFSPLDKLMRHYMKPDVADSSSKNGTPPITRRQAIARRRLHWVGKVFVRRVHEIQRGIEDNVLFALKTSLSKDATDGMLDHALKIANSFTLNVTSVEMLGRKPVCDIRSALAKELADEGLYLVRDSVPSLMNSNLWCPLSRNLVRTVCLEMSDLIAAGQAGPDSAAGLKARILTHALAAAKTIRRLAQSSEEPGKLNLSFATGTEGTLKVDTAGNRDVNLCGAFAQNSLCYKGAVSALIDHKEQRAGVASVLLGSYPKEIVVHENVLMAVAVSDNDGNKNAIRANPRRFELFENGKCRINAVWYLVWQVMQPLYKVWEGWLGFCGVAETTDLTKNFFDELCQTIKVEKELASEMLVRDVAVNIPKLKMNFCPKSSLVSAGLQKKKKPARRSMNGKGPGKDKGPRPGGEGNKNKRMGSRPGGNRLMFIFEGTLWKTLTQLGWQRDWGTRPRDHYFLPPGVRRHSGFRNRVDFFDSVKLVIECCRSHPKWSNVEEVKKSLGVFDKCCYYNCNHKMPSGELDIDWLIKEALAAPPPPETSITTTLGSQRATVPNRAAATPAINVGNAISSSANGMIGANRGGATMATPVINLPSMALAVRRPGNFSNPIVESTLGRMPVPAMAPTIARSMMMMPGSAITMNPPGRQVRWPPIAQAPPPMAQNMPMLIGAYQNIVRPGIVPLGHSTSLLGARNMQQPSPISTSWFQNNSHSGNINNKRSYQTMSMNEALTLFSASKRPKLQGYR